MLFFSKKYFLADLLGGLTDMHCHILPNMDDGPRDKLMALEMLQQYIELGYQGLIATPHIMEGFYENTISGITESQEEFRKLADERGYTDFLISAAAEYMMDGGFDKLLETKEFLPIVGNRVLVEMSFLQPSLKVFDHIFILQQKGFEPILAHPERYPYLSDISQILNFQKKGCSLQLDLLSLGEHYGKQSKQMAISLLENDHYQFLGTDAHHSGHLLDLRKITLPKKTLPHFEALVERTKANLTD